MSFGTYFTEKKKRHATEDLRTIYDCAKRAGVDHALFVGFGLLLGMVREKDFIGHDNDVDMCILSDKITPQQESQYHKLLVKAGMCAARFHYALKDVEKGFMKSRVVPGDSNDQVRFAWFSIRRRRDRAKFCHWFMFPWNGYYWHSKSGMWVKPSKFSQTKWGYDRNDDAIMQGLPQQYLSELVNVGFRNIKVNVPVKAGSCLDYWYPGWLKPKSRGSSSHRTVGIIKDWLNQKTWRVAQSAVV